MSISEQREVLNKIENALQVSCAVLARFTSGEVDFRLKPGADPVTEADTAVNEVLRELLPRNGDGWLSEESADDLSRMSHRRVWIVDPLDGTREFIKGIPEWCISIALV